MQKKHPLTIEDRNIAQDYIERAEGNLKDAWHELQSGNLRRLYLLLSIARQRVSAALEVVALSQIAKNQDSNKTKEA